MAKGVSNVSVYAKHILDPESVIFSIYTAKELKKLCTTRIHTALTFDVLGHPLPGGLYDRTMGPLSEKSLPCGTCYKNVNNCPGHLGYIELPLPVVNPIFHSIVATIIKLSCLHCHKMQIPECTKKLIALYMKLLDCGMVTEAKEVEQITKVIISERKFEEELPEGPAKRIRKLERLANSIGDPGNSKNILNKTTESLRNKLLHELVKILKVNKCIHCKCSIANIQFTRRKLIVNVKPSDENKWMQKNVINNDLITLLKAVDIKIMMPEESRDHLRKVWIHDKELLIELVPVLKRISSRFPTDNFYFKIIPVVPPICRPVNYLQGTMVEHPQSQIYKSILQDSMVIRTIITVMQGKEISTLSEESQTVYELSQGANVTEKLHNLWQSLQVNVDCVMDRELNPNRNDSLGLKQILEKKGGIFRMHMMGKRVNFAARSVITPDPNLNIDEIGVPEEFAKHLTYPVPVTSWNVEELRKMVLNGPNVHPGAKMIEFGDGSVFKIGTGKTQQESILKRLLTPVDGDKEGFKGMKIVHRHLINGDVLLLNRQPTLHRPGIMAHTARILKDEKTIRLHYANCKAYNADFDGDEMNMHFPQSELARSEGYTLVNVSNNYLVPKDGTPLSGLIQDHMVSGVKMSVRGKFFTRSDYHQLVYSAIGYKTGHIVLLEPAILKPVIMWSGKQLLSTVIINIIPKHKEPLNLTATAKISAKAWINHTPRPWMAGGTPFKNHNDMTEAEVVIRQGELLVGVLDKTHYGATPYGLIHCMYELYGGQYATRLLSSFAKLFTCFLQQQGFTLGVHDILVQEKADKKRSKIIEECRKIGHTASALAVDLPPETSQKVLLEKLEVASAKNPKFRTIIDRQYKQSLDSFTNEINKTCLPAGLVCKFPANNLQLMVQSGAKGSTVNTMQISCLLGQIELEGKRPPVMISGKSLPSFVPFDPQPRAGGFIDGRFMTGILPQEFFFHCMAGREGLIDTAVKTSRSGYLQRCLVKHLEGLRVCYDLTVRDSDQSVIQYFYGEDGMDISKVQFLNKKQLKFLAENRKAIVNEDIIKDLIQVDGYADMEEHKNKLKEWKSEYGNALKNRKTSAFLRFSQVVREKIDLEKSYTINPKTGRSIASEHIIELWQNASRKIKASFEKETDKCPNPVPAEFAPDHYYGSLTDHIEQMLDEYSKKNKRDTKLSDTLTLKAMQSLAAPGEPVGLLAAQSIGEPSTQMTLNTFHFAGRGEMNVTLGIPRLREILMMASEKIKTPSMEIPFCRIPNVENAAEHLRKGLTRVTVANVLEKIDVCVELETSPVRQHSYTLRFHFLPKDLYKNDFNVTPKQILKHMNKKFFGALFSYIRKVAKASASVKLVDETQDKVAARKKKTGDDEDEDGNVPEPFGDDDDDDSSEEEPEGGEEDAKLTYKHKAAVESQEPDDEEKEKSDDEEMEDEEYERKKLGDSNMGNYDEIGMDDSVVQNYTFAQNYLYDKVNFLWCELTFCLPMGLRNIDLTALIKDCADKSVVSEVENIKRAITYMKDDKELTLRTDGINMAEMFKHIDLLDLNRLYSNDIHKIAQTYGIEAARRVIVKEVKDVFNVYGITVDPRHLLLIADYMTYNGSFEPLSRKGMESSASPLQQMSFESSLTFLKNASIKGKEDSLTSPSSCLMIGKPCYTGTGAFSLLQKMPTIIS